MMRTIYIVFNNRDKVDTCTNLFDDLKFVFEEYVNVKICFLDEISKGDIDDGDLYLVLYKERVSPMKQYISSIDKVIVMARTFERKYLDEVFSLQAGTDVLVVSDSEENTIQTTNSLYELGLNHLNLVPYIEKEDDGKYNHIKIAITPAEKEMIPEYINRIIDVENRCIDTNTFVTIINKLNLNNREVTKNLLSYIRRTTGSMGQRYITDSIKEQMLKQTIQESRESIIIVDNNYSIVHYNDKADIAFKLTENSQASLKEIFENVLVEIFTTNDYVNKLVKFNDINYMVTKTAIRVVEQIIGYSLRFSTETDIKNLEIDLNKQLMKRGFVAKYSFDDIIYKSEIMEKTVKLAKQVALTDYTILINGESGTGKELFAQSIHNFSARKGKPFVAINCAALPETLLESELFGYEKGAFTGASPQGKIGRFEQANHGTIFLDEIGDMSLNLQARLLRVLQEKEITRIGSEKVMELDIRVLAATNKNLVEAIKKREFREDLYYRLCNIQFKIPALREKKEDITLLFKCFLGSKFDEMTAGEINIIENYSWPGNIRELRNVADYYRTLGELPITIFEDIEAGQDIILPSVSDIKKEPVSMKDKPDVDEIVLYIIRENTSEYCVIGRTSILNELHRRGISLSDDKLRKLIHKLERQNKIKIGRGRTGCMIV